MSFILDALKKSDKKRQDGEIPKLETVHRTSQTGLEQRAKWRWLLLLLLICNALVLFWLFGPWSPAQQDTEPPVVVAPAAVPLEVPAAAVIQQPAEPLVLPPVPEAVPSGSVALPLPAAEPVTPPSAAANPLLTPVPDDAVQPEKLYLPAELPVALRQNLPALHMSLHAFNPASATASLVRIDDQIMRVGSRLANRYLLEEITADGAIFRYENYRILVPRKQVHGN